MFAETVAVVLRMRRRPRSTLFPHPTLCRSTAPSGAERCAAARAALRGRVAGAPAAVAARGARRGSPPRSEEHTSELQSRQYLACRLPLDQSNFAALQRIAPPVLGRYRRPTP